MFSIAANHLPPKTKTDDSQENRFSGKQLHRGPAPDTLQVFGGGHTPCSRVATSVWPSPRAVAPASPRAAAANLRALHTAARPSVAAPVTRGVFLRGAAAVGRAARDPYTWEGGGIHRAARIHGGDDRRGWRWHGTTTLTCHGVHGTHWRGGGRPGPRTRLGSGCTRSATLCCRCAPARDIASKTWRRSGTFGWPSSWLQHMRSRRG